MSSLQFFVLAALIPLFFGSPRAAGFWLSAQALALAWHVTARDGLHSVHTVLAVVDILMVRGLLAPWLYRRVSRARESVAPHLLPPNLFSWLLAVAVAVLGFEFAATAELGEATLAIGSVCLLVLLALLLLALNDAGEAQLFALLLLENAALLFELTLSELGSPWVHGTLTSIYVLTVVSGVWRLQDCEDERIDAARPMQ